MDGEVSAGMPKGFDFIGVGILTGVGVGDDRIGITPFPQIGHDLDEFGRA